jgi:hypothetical protein
VPPFDAATLAAIDEALASFATADAVRVKSIERTTNHDVKAVEYWMKERFAPAPAIARAAEFIHFACTSEDINNLAHGLALATPGATCWSPALRGLAASFARSRTGTPGARCSRARTASRRRRPRSARSSRTSSRGSSARPARSSASSCSAR